MRKVRYSVFVIIYCFIIISGCKKDNQPDDNSIIWLEATEQVNGTLTVLENIQVLKVYGSYYEMGYAHGYLLAQEIFERQELELSQPGIVDFFENYVLPNLQLFHIPEQYLDEIEGMYNGVKARADGSLYTDILGREVTLNDAIALNCISALASRLQCSAFSAWNNVTDDNSVITGYNHDTEDNERFTGQWLIIARKPSAALATVCVGRAGDMNVHTAMNEHGVTLSCHGVNDANSATSSEGFTPEGIIFRELIEKVDSINPVEDISALLNDRYPTEAEALLISWPAGRNLFSAAAVELDGDLTINNGFTIREPDTDKEYIVQTNDFRLRKEPPETECERYYYLNATLDSISGGLKTPLTIESAWILLGEIHPHDSYLTQHAVIFEPLKKRIHIAFAEQGIHAHSCDRVTVDIDDLLPQ